MIVWIIAGMLGWGSMFAVIWVPVFGMEIDLGTTIVLLLLGFIVGLFSAFMEGANRQQEAKMKQLSMRGPSIVYTGTLEHTNGADESKTATDS